MLRLLTRTIQLHRAAYGQRLLGNTPMTTQLESVVKWYRSHCDGDWEHDKRIRLSTIGNPGWHLEVNVSGTAAAGKSVALTALERDGRDWVHYKVEADCFTGHFGAANLSELLGVFLAFVSNAGV